MICTANVYEPIFCPGKKLPGFRYEKMTRDPYFHTLGKKGFAAKLECVKILQLHFEYDSCSFFE
jgi:hypothetical protein